MQKYIDKFHYLTQDLPGKTHAEQAEIACKAGANWIQYRCLTKNDEQLINEINQLALIADDWGATLIITEHYHLLDRVDVQGIHIENMDTDLVKIRNYITDEKTLGASANSFEDVERIAATGVVDYIGCGPFSITKTKVNNHPLLGVEGYRNIVSKMRDTKINIPVLAVGGIKSENVKDLLDTGVYGIAVSAAVNLADDPSQALKELRNYFT